MLKWILLLFVMFQRHIRTWNVVPLVIISTSKSAKLIYVHENIFSVFPQLYNTNYYPSILCMIPYQVSAF